MGADHVLDLTATSARGAARRRSATLTHGGAPTSSSRPPASAAAVHEGLDLARDGGRYVIAGHYTDAGASTINAHQPDQPQTPRIRGCWGSEAGHFLRALVVPRALRRQVPWREIGGRIYPLIG